MKKNTSLVFIVLLTLLLSVAIADKKYKKRNSNCLSKDTVEIYEISTQNGKLTGPPIGSVEGGTNIYIHASGHDLTPSNNQITVGPYPCLIPESGINENIITCTTTKAHDPL
jgi:hypothetical protein